MRISEQEFMMFMSHLDNAQAHKRRSGDTVAYGVNWVSNLVRDLYARKERTTRVRRSYVFLVSRPKWREIIGTEFAGRLCDHELCDTLGHWIERELHPRTFNNRCGFGCQMAMNTVVEDINAVEHCGDEAWVIKWDLSGFFPSALWPVVYDVITRVIEKYRAEIAESYGDEYPDYLRWLAMIVVHGNPAAHLEWRTSKSVWREHIQEAKSIIGKPEGVGMPIGRLISQVGMGLYLNDEVEWLNEQCGVRTTVFMDDAVMVVPERLKDYALSLLPALRERLGAKGLKLNEKKFYCQKASHGYEFLGSHFMPGRVHLNNKTYGQALRRIGEFNACVNKYVRLDDFVAVVNSYAGLLNGRRDYARVQKMRFAIAAEWWQWLEWDAERRCLVFKRGYGRRERLRCKYKIKYKQQKRKDYDTGRKGRPNG